MEHIAPSLPIIITVCLTTVGIILTVVLLNNGTNGKIDDLRKETHANEIQITRIQERSSQMHKDISNLLTRVVKLEGSVVKLEASVVEIKVSVVKLEGSVVELKESVVKLEGSVVKLEGTVVELEESVVKLETSGPTRKRQI